MRITALMENTCQREDLACEHGLSLYIEANGRKLLFDMGQSGAFWDNAGALGIDLGEVEFALVSHGHYDHGGGLSRFLAGNQGAPVYVSPHFFDSHRNAQGKEIGVAALESSRIRFVQGELELALGITICTAAFPPEDTAGMTAVVDGREIPEDFRHEQYLSIREKGRHVLISGCSHKGIVGIAEHFRPDVLVGGFHFMKVEDRTRLDAAAERLLALPAVYHTGHCTGLGQYAYLKEKMGQRLHYLATGMTLVI